MIIMDERAEIERLIDGDISVIKKIGTQAAKIARYNLHCLGMEEQENYEFIVDWMNKYATNFQESAYGPLINEVLRTAKKYPIIKIDSIKITKSEVNAIQSVNNIRQEKMLFVMLCVAKYQRITRGYTNGLVSAKDIDLFKSARLSTPAADRDMFIHELMQTGLIRQPKKSHSQGYILNFMSENYEEDEIFGEILPDNCNNLAYWYLYYAKNDTKHLRICQDCGLIYRAKMDKITKYCMNCSPKHRHDAPPQEIKTVICVDCQREFTVNSKAARTIRCPECNDIYQKRRNADKNFDYRARKKS